MWETHVRVDCGTCENNKEVRFIVNTMEMTEETLPKKDKDHEIET